MPWNDPLLPKKAIQGTQDWLEQPTEGQSPLMAGIKGFGSGALEGLRNLTTPTSLASIATLPFGGGEAKALGSAADLSQIVPDLVQAGQGVKQVAPTAEDAASLIGQLKYGLAKVPKAGANASQNAIQGLQGALPAEMVPQGGEAAFNAARAAKQAAGGTPSPMSQLPSPYNFGRIPILSR